MRRPIHFALRCYPKWWRHKYGDQVCDLAEELIDLGESSTLLEAASLVRTGTVERIRSARRQNPVVLNSSHALVIAVVALAALFSQSPSRLLEGSSHQGDIVVTPTPIIISNTAVIYDIKVHTHSLWRSGSLQSSMAGTLTKSTGTYL